MYDEQDVDEFVEKEMYKVRKEAMEKLSSIFAHLKYIDDFALTLAYSWFDSQEFSIRIASDLDLDKLDFLAIQEAFDSFKELYLKEYENAQNF